MPVKKPAGPLAKKAEKKKALKKTMAKIARKRRSMKPGRGSY